jgi:hypothetical protein
MITAIPKARSRPGRTPGAQRVKTLRDLGTCTNVKMESLVKGNLLLLSGFVYVVLSPEEDRNGKDSLVLRELEHDTLRSLRYDPAAWVTQLQVSPQVVEHEGQWVIQNGDIVLYPGATPGQGVAVVRHPRGWIRTAAPWMPSSDAEVVLHVTEGRAKVVRSALRRPWIPPSPPYGTGCVVACRDIKLPEPTVWIRSGDDYWISSTRATASDSMINYEIQRGTYHVAWTPEEIRKDNDDAQTS